MRDIQKVIFLSMRVMIFQQDRSEKLSVKPW